MTYWTLEQALTWAMWRDEGRASRAADGHVGPALPRQVEELPSDDPDALVRWLLENGEVEFVPMAHDDPHRGRERRWGTEERTGHMVCIEGWRERQGAPLCTDGVLLGCPRERSPSSAITEAKKRAAYSSTRRSRARRRRGHAGQPVRGSSDGLALCRAAAVARQSRWADIGADRLHGKRNTCDSTAFPVEEIRGLWPPLRSAPRRSPHRAE